MVLLKRRGAAVIFATLILVMMVLTVNYVILIEHNPNDRNKVRILCELLDIIEAIILTTNSTTFHSYIILLNDSLKLTLGVTIKEVGIGHINNGSYVYVVCTDGRKGYILIRKI